MKLIGTTRESRDEYVIGFECARGRKLRIHCNTNVPRIGQHHCAPGEAQSYDPDHAADAGAGRD